MYSFVAKIGTDMDQGYISRISLPVRHETLEAFHSIHIDDDISLFVALLDIPVSLGNLFQWIAPVDDSL